MADDLHYVPGEWYRIDDRSGFKVRNRRTRKEWTGLIVKDTAWEPRNTQDFVRGVRDDQSVTEPRPRQANVFLYLQTTLATLANAGAASLSLTSSQGMSNGDSIWVVCDDGSLLRTTLSGAPVGNTVTLAQGLPFKASAGNVFTDISVTPNSTKPANYPRSG